MSRRWSSASIGPHQQLRRPIPFSTLQSRFQRSSICGIAGCGRAKKDGRARLRSSPPAARVRSGRDDRVLHVTTFKDPMKEMDKLHELYESLAEARPEVGQKRCHSTSSPS